MLKSDKSGLKRKRKFAVNASVPAGQLWTVIISFCSQYYTVTFCHLLLSNFFIIGANVYSENDRNPDDPDSIDILVPDTSTNTLNVNNNTDTQTPKKPRRSLNKQKNKNKSIIPLLYVRLSSLEPGSSRLNTVPTVGSFVKVAYEYAVNKKMKTRLYYGQVTAIFGSDYKVMFLRNHHDKNKGFVFHLIDHVDAVTIRNIRRCLNYPKQEREKYIFDLCCIMSQIYINFSCN